jgi:hypothetical protein
MLFTCITDCLNRGKTKNCCCTATSFGVSDIASAVVELTGRATLASIRQLYQRLYKIRVYQAPHLNLLYMTCSALPYEGYPNHTRYNHVR